MKWHFSHMCKDPWIDMRCCLRAVVWRCMDCVHLQDVLLCCPDWYIRVHNHKCAVSLLINFLSESPKLCEHDKCGPHSLLHLTWKNTRKMYTQILRKEFPMRKLKMPLPIRQIWGTSARFWTRDWNSFIKSAETKLNRISQEWSICLSKQIFESCRIRIRK